ncbi:asparagine synthase (glutamine-hydrolyzing) [Chitinophaga rhizophila]|uniref:asparagine synthase (glutamine-hydrolyzing) n=1 Tax=Chitinophaga rhizophila TaxID=2866212 RepID=A0ABS7GHQ0_9BACT|nr:asparagine synthase (glutamine-hydrolyzing) [Chitinophaga rhizophila]MBW8687221.1 asparagine synthase (glutamine-hydrolyzing) [Chitinophaga rhizophila]
MCGICGYVRFKEQTTGYNEQVIRDMNKQLLHRGPDSQTVHQFDNVALGFTRLSIIGLDNGMQPIFNEDESVVLLCNGEIFNYIELRQSLREKGHRFRTASDVEVIVHLYEEQGMTFLNELNGQFAFALYDKKRKTLFCARDHMGIIPFFYTVQRDTFIFASEIKAILQHPLVTPRVDLTGLDQVFTFPGLISPRTTFKDIFSLENGHYLSVTHDGVVTDNEYWDLIFPEEGQMEEQSPSYYINRLEELFENAVRLRLRADVPYGLYLSGGLDSSMIAMKVHQLDATASKQVFSIDFVDARLSETLYQQLVAKQMQANINRKTFFFEDISERLQQAVYHSECPVKESYNTASLSLSAAVRNRDIKVILSGEGADELFAGYVGYRFDKIRSMAGSGQDVSPVEAAWRDQVWGDPTYFYETNFEALCEQKKQLYSGDIAAEFDEINCLRHFVINKNRIAGRDILNKRAYIDYKLRLVDHLVADHGDRMAMANSVEVRYPFLDKDFVAFAATVPSSLKLYELEEKYILKKMGSRFIPKEIVEREKFGFTAPGSPYLLRRNIEFIQDTLSFDRIKQQGIFNPQTIEMLKQQYSADGFTINAPFENDVLMTVLTFGILQEQYFN